MIKNKDLWLWGQDAGSHHAVSDNAWNLPGENKMEPMEGAEYLHIPNMCRIAMSGLPKPPFDKEAEKFSSCGEVVWSIMGDSESKRFNAGDTDVDAVLDIAKKYPNITGGAMDDFFSGTRMSVFTPEVLHGLAEKLHTLDLKLWTVVYIHDLEKDISAHLAECDVISLWHWCAEELQDIRGNFEKLKGLLPVDKKIYAGCYFWDYGNSKPLSMDDMRLQLEQYEALYDEGIISGVIFCSNCIADIGLDTVEYTKKWIEERM